MKFYPMYKRRKLAIFRSFSFLVTITIKTAVISGFQILPCLLHTSQGFVINNFLQLPKTIHTSLSKLWCLLELQILQLRQLYSLTETKYCVNVAVISSTAYKTYKVKRLVLNG